MEQPHSNTSLPLEGQRDINLALTKKQAQLIYVGLVFLGCSLPNPPNTKPSSMSKEEFLKTMCDCYGLEYSPEQRQDIFKISDAITFVANLHNQGMERWMDKLEDYPPNDDEYGNTGEVIQLKEGESLQVEPS